MIANVRICLCLTLGNLFEPSSGLQFVAASTGLGLAGHERGQAVLQDWLISSMWPRGRSVNVPSASTCQPSVRLSH